MTTQTGHQDPGEAGFEVEFTAERLIFFSDAVVAIAITLLAFELPLPLPNATNATTDAQLLDALPGKGTAYLAFLIGFVVIGSHWRAHHRLFRSVTRLDPVVTTLNMVWLFLIVIQPVATRVLAGNGAFGVRFSFYAAIQVATLLCFLLMTRRVRRLRSLRAAAEDSPAGDMRLMAAVAMFAVSIPLAFETHWAYLCWLAAPAAVRAEQWLRRLRSGADQAAAD
jgi:uncharacterized membrane protein